MVSTFGMIYMVAVLCSHLQGTENAACRNNIVSCVQQKMGPTKKEEQKVLQKAFKEREKCLEEQKKPLTREQVAVCDAYMTFVDAGTNPEDLVEPCARKQGVPGMGKKPSSFESMAKRGKGWNSFELN